MTTDTFESASPAARPRPTSSGEPEEVKRDRFGRYLLPECNLGPAQKKEVPFTRATTFAKSISDTFTLSAWSQRMVAKGIATRQDLRMAAATLDVKADKDALNEICEQAKEAANAKSAARLGSAVHAFTERLDAAWSVDDRNDAFEAAQEYEPNVRKYAATLAAHGIEVMPGMIERIVVWKRYSIAGTFDRLAMWNGISVVLDLKTGRDLTYGWNEIAIQLCIYAHADGIWNPQEWRWEAMPAVSRRKALVVHLPVVDQDVADPPCTIYEVDLEPALVACQLCYDVREWRRVRDLALPLVPPAPGQPSNDWAARLLACASDGELRHLWSEITRNSIMADDPVDESLMRDAFRRRAAEIRELAG